MCLDEEEKLSELSGLKKFDANCWVHFYLLSWKMLKFHEGAGGNCWVLVIIFCGFFTARNPFHSHLTHCSYKHIDSPVLYLTNCTSCCRCSTQQYLISMFKTQRAKRSTRNNGSINTNLHVKPVHSWTQPKMMFLYFLTHSIHSPSSSLSAEACALFVKFQKCN